METSVRVGAARVGAIEDEFDGGVDLGGHVEARVHPRLGVEFQANRTFGLNPRPAPCGLAVPCSGSAVEGVKSVVHYSANVLYYFAAGRPVEFYVLSGVGGLHSRTERAATFGSGQIVQLPEESDRGLSIGVGGGVRIAAGPKLSIRPEFRWYDSSVRSRANLSLIQFGVRVGYRW